MKYMTAREEDILTNQNYIENGTVIDKLLQSLIVTPLDYNSLLIGDKNAILVAARILGYGAEYEFNYGGKNHDINLTEMKDKPLDKSLVVNGINEFTYTLPASKINITFKLLTHGDERKIDQELKGLKRLNKDSSFDISTRMKHIITSINGDRENKNIRKFVDEQLLARDARDLRNYIKEIQPDIDLSFDYEEKNGNFKKVTIPVSVNFFWPDVEL
tara:strand:- start:6 stop:653 length:648 start_codon:yes stop_codon:yes gene_type:complete